MVLAAFDPNVWSGRALQEDLFELGDMRSCINLCSRGISRVRHRKYTPGCSRRTFAMAFSPCLRKSRKSAQTTSSLNALREPRGRPAGLPDCPRCQRLVGICCCRRVDVEQVYDGVVDSAIWPTA